jgi:hypothetical protein
MQACPSRIASIIIWDFRRIACLPNPIGADSRPTGLPAPRNRERGGLPGRSDEFRLTRRAANSGHVYRNPNPVLQHPVMCIASP